MQRSTVFRALLGAALSLWGAETARCQPKHRLHGFVERWNDHQPASFAKMGIHNIDSAEANQDGEFSLLVPATLQPDFPLDFYVRDWIVFSPNVDGIYGRMTFVGFDPHKYKLLVVKKGDRILVSDSGIHNLLLAAIGHFERLAVDYIGTKQRLAPTVVHPSIVPASVVLEKASPTDTFFRQWFVEQSKILGFSDEELAQAVASWVARADSSMDKGLAYLYQDKLDDALEQFKAAESDTKILPLKAEAFAYGLRRDWPDAASKLRSAIQASRGKDASLYASLATVLEFDGKPQEAEQALDEVDRILRRNGLAPARRRPRGFDYYKVSLTWIPNYCASPSAGIGDRCKDARVGFALQHLTPRWNNIFVQPSYCRLYDDMISEDVPTEVVEHMSKYFLDPSAVRAEWKSHGSCTRISAVQYFANAEQAFQSIHVPEAYLHLSQPLEIPVTEIELAFSQVNSAPLKAFRVSCVDKNLVAVEVCMSKDLKFRACVREPECEVGKVLMRH